MSANTSHHLLTEPASEYFDLPTTFAPFNHVPAAAADLMAVQPGVARRYALSEANCLLEYVAERLSAGVQTPITETEAFGLEFAVRSAQALYAASGSEV